MLQPSMYKFNMNCETHNQFRDEISCVTKAQIFSLQDQLLLLLLLLLL